MVATMWDDTLISQHINSYHLQSHDVTPALQYITNLHTSFYRRTTGVLTDLIQAAVPQTSRPIFLVPVGDIYKRNLRNTELTVKGISKPCVISYLTTTFTLKKPRYYETAHFCVKSCTTIQLHGFLTPEQNYHTGASSGILSLILKCK